MAERAVFEQLLVDLHLFGNPQAVRHLDDINPVDKSLVVAVRLEGLPLRLIGMRKDDAFEGYGAETLGALVVTLLGSSQQWVQHFDRGLEHLDELEQPLVGMTQTAGESIRIGSSWAKRSSIRMSTFPTSEEMS